MNGYKEIDMNNTGSSDHEECFALTKWHEKKFSGEEQRSYKFYNGKGTCCYSFYGDKRALDAIDRFMKYYRYFRNIFA